MSNVITLFPDPHRVQVSELTYLGVPDRVVQARNCYHRLRGLSQELAGTPPAVLAAAVGPPELEAVRAALRRLIAAVERELQDVRDGRR